MTIDSVKKMKDALCEKLKVSFGSTVEEASDAQMMRASALVLRDVMAERSVDTMRETREEHRRQVHYLSMEFLMGRSLMKNAFNLGVGEILTEALDELGFRAADIFESEPDAGLGNGGLGRLAACYLDSMTTLDIPAAGYSICYELGIFRQRIVDGQQVELPDNWKDLGGAWLLPKPQETETVRFGGTVRQFWDDGRLHVVPEGETEVLAIPCDMEIAGYGTKHVNTLRLWDAKSPVPLDMSLFSQGEYLRAQEQHAMAETIAKVLYPEDNHPEGKSLRLKQQYFFVSATVQSIVRKHIEVYGTAANFHEKNVIQINDTHPALVIPELMRILMDDAGLDWDTAWHITTHSVAYTNHTVLSEALERWPQELMQSLLPRVWTIITEIARRYQEKIENYYHDEAKTRELAIIWDGQVRMANLCIAGGMAVNGVSALHSDILRNDVFKYQCAMEPEKFKNVTNGIDHRRWLAQINPRLDELVRALAGGDEYLLHPEALKKLEAYADDAAVLNRLGEIKRANKLDFAAYVKKTQGIVLNTDAIFDVQVKRLHEYKRQLLNAMHIIYLYQQLQNDPNRAMQPRVFLFGAKAAPGYAVAKRIIRLINSLAAEINADPICRDRLQVVFLENYRVSLAEHLMPASEVSQQISTAGKEASGTGNMKFMMNGALTVGTLDGANVEMHERLGDENMFLFGLHADEVVRLKREGYTPQKLYARDENLRAVIDKLKAGFSDGVSYDDLASRLLMNDEYMLLQDFASYCAAEQRMADTYARSEEWNRMSLINIARSGIFADARVEGRDRQGAHRHGQDLCLRHPHHRAHRARQRGDRGCHLSADARARHADHGGTARPLRLSSGRAHRVPVRRCTHRPSDRRAEKAPQIVVATPGRLSDHMKRRTVKLDNVKTVVLDEADRMLDMGFIHDVTRILDKLPSRRNLGMFSATISREVMDISWMYQRDPEEITVQAKEENKPDIAQYRIDVGQNDKAHVMAQIIRAEGHERVMAFCNTKGMTERLKAFLMMEGLEADCIHGDIPQKKREAVMARFRRGDRCRFSTTTSRPMDAK